MIAAAVANLRARVGLPAHPARRGPVPLDRFFQELNLSHVAVPRLTLGGVVDHLRAEGVPVEDIGEPATTLAGFLFAAGRIGVVFVNADDILGRRRFTAAHELGHAVLHREKMGQFIADADIAEADEATAVIEREANHFAVELLMPEEVVRARAAELRAEYSACPRIVLAYRLASELLVSLQAMRYRLKTLEVGDDN
jgi:Zn-dependent peptidase ImmA (M78 family)